MLELFGHDVGRKILDYCDAWTVRTSLRVTAAPGWFLFTMVYWLTSCFNLAYVRHQHVDTWWPEIDEVDYLAMRLWALVWMLVVQTVLWDIWLHIGCFCVQKRCSELVDINWVDSQSELGSMSVSACVINRDVFFAFQSSLLISCVCAVGVSWCWPWCLVAAAWLWTLHRQSVWHTPGSLHSATGKTLSGISVASLLPGGCRQAVPTCRLENTTTTTGRHTAADGTVWNV